ncbi:MAG: hypothetical protein A2X59_03525 [Nitrospirae bacterium GWC2_42_7]|nr:MAG: hypothetical protein A2X59_03525 [Nitrospirae bacterium GWC2_42_7]
MKAELIEYSKVIDELGNTVEINLWKLPEPTEDKPHGYKYSLVYIVGDKRVIGYDNAERKGDHRHIRGTVKPYKFINVWKLIQDFYRDMEKFKRGEL